MSRLRDAWLVLVGRKVAADPQAVHGLKPYSATTSADGFTLTYR